jgi:ferrochelatase
MHIMASHSSAVCEHQIPASNVATEVLLLNFGGPQKKEDVQAFLQKIFEDRFIIRAPLGRFFRKHLARRIARQRTPETARQYQSIGYSPINVYTQRQADYLQRALLELNPQTRVRVVNRYTEPFACHVIPHLEIQRERLFLLPLYPQFCHSTTTSSIREVDLAIGALHHNCLFPAVKIFSWWHNPMFLAYSWRLIAETLQPLLQRDGQIHVVFSAHGIPRAYALRGDPYPQEVRAQYHMLCQRGRDWIRQQGAEVDKVTWQLSFQSRIGPVEWLRPYTTDLVANADRKKRGHLVMVPISFTSDHIETLYEMDRTYKEIALQNGFSTYARVRCPNDDPQFAACLQDILIQHGF